MARRCLPGKRHSPSCLKCKNNQKNPERLFWIFVYLKFYYNTKLYTKAAMIAPMIGPTIGTQA